MVQSYFLKVCFPNKVYNYFIFQNQQGFKRLTLSRQLTMENPLVTAEELKIDISPKMLSPREDGTKTPENLNPPPTSSNESSPTTPHDDVTNLAGLEGYSSSTSSTPRDESSSGSPSPIPDDFIGENGLKQKPTVRLGKDISMMMQALNTLQSPEEKIAALCKKYADLLEQQKMLKKQLRLSQRKQAQTFKEKEQLQSENSRAVLAKTKIENLARELQKRNKSLQEEHCKKSMEEVNLRQEMASNFQTTLNRIENQMKTAVAGSNQLQSENERMGGKLNEIVKNYQAREAAMENLVKQYEMQDKILSKQIEKNLLEQAEQKEASRVEKTKLLEQLVERTQLYEDKLKQEKELRAQLEYYSEKFEEFQSTLEKSNQIFNSYRAEMDKMGKKLTLAEKDRMKVQKKWEDSTKALADTVDYTQQLETKQARLERLSRALQGERNNLLGRLREYEGDSATPKVKTATKPKKKESKKQDKKTPSADDDTAENKESINDETSADVADPPKEEDSTKEQPPASSEEIPVASKEENTDTTEEKSPPSDPASKKENEDESSCARPIPDEAVDPPSDPVEEVKVSSEKSKNDVSSQPCEASTNEVTSPIESSTDQSDANPPEEDTSTDASSRQEEVDHKDPSPPQEQGSNSQDADSSEVALKEEENRS